MLKTNGLGHPETMALVIKWTQEQEEKAEANGTPEARIDFEINRVDLYLAVGDTEGALGCLEDARIIALNEYNDELREQIEKKMDEIEVVK